MSFLCSPLLNHGAWSWEKILWNSELFTDFTIIWGRWNKSCILMYLYPLMPKSLPGLTRYNSTVDLIKSIFPFQKLLWWWMWQREFWWNATLPWSRCSSSSIETFIPLLTFQFLLHLDEKFTLGSKFIIQVISSISCQSPKKKHLFSGSWRHPLVHLSRRAGATESSDRWLDGQDIGAHCWGRWEEVKAEKKLGI